MTARTYDVVLYVNDASGFTPSNVLIGNSSLAVGVISAVDTSNNTLKVRLANSLQKYSSTEVVHSNTTTISGTANGALQSGSLPFVANVISGNVTTAIATVSATAPSGFIAAKNAFVQNPLVRLYSIYYPGEWYPPNEAGNPTGEGAGRAWPNAFPIKFAEIVADTAGDLSYNVIHAGTEYTPFPVDVTGIDQGTDGKINELTISIFNVDNIISALVEDPYLTGNNISNSVIAYVNGEPVHGIDPRTVNATPADVGSLGDDSFDSLTRARANGLSYSVDYVNFYGSANSSFNINQTTNVKGTWVPGKADTRDLLGAVVDIKTTFANFLDYWPEYSLITDINSNVITVSNVTPYRVGDVVRPSKDANTATVLAINEHGNVYLDTALFTSTAVTDPLYIVNAEVDPESYLLDNFKINQLESMNEHIAKFGLVSWLQYFKVVTPKRKYYKNTCQWKYKGEECQYPGSGQQPIPGTDLLSNIDPIAANNEVAATDAEDVCSKSLEGCTIRNNARHFGGFPGTGRTVPRA
jgi:lambda family phage minor tail protein L